MPMLMPKGEGLTKRCRCAYIQPATQASTAATTKITIFWREVSTPIASAITRPPRKARIARPSRESSRLLIIQIAASSTTQAR